MRYDWKMTQGVEPYNKERGYGFVTGAVYHADPDLQIPETNAGWIPMWWYGEESIHDVACREQGVVAVPTDEVSKEALAGRQLPVWYRQNVPAEGAYRVTVTIAGVDAGEEIRLFIGRRRLVWHGVLAAGEERTVTAYCDVYPFIPWQMTEIHEITAVNLTVMGGALQGVIVEDAPEVRHLWCLGDSTVTDQSGEIPYAPGTCYSGWGQMLPHYLSDVCISNHAHGGLTTETMTSEGHWDIVRPRIHEGDLVMLQFGHNDEKLAHLQAAGGYTQRLRGYIEEIRAAGALPILVTSLARNSWKAPGEYWDLLAGYAEAVKAVGKAEDVPVIDLHAYSMALVQEEGVDLARRWFHPGDYTHTNDFGAYRMAGYVAGQLGEILGMEIAAAPEWTPAPPDTMLAPPADCKVEAPADYVPCVWEDPYVVAGRLGEIVRQAAAEAASGAAAGADRGDPEARPY